jgi:hypothetical protein
MVEITSANGFKLNQRVQIAPAYDAWMQGDRFGEILRFRRSVDRTRTIATLVMDRSKRRIRIDVEDLTPCD